ncbi:cobaltochelatase subunit CobN [Lysobacteraceae bacterium NML07-0707]|nr:cobaltochelatase subunit CobN [Xanthomonadaceae bacterium NML07-0707]
MLRALLFVLLACLCLPVQAGESLRLVIISTDFNLNGKTRKMRQWGAPEGVQVQHVSVDSPPPGGPARWLAAADIAVLDTPAGGHAARVRGMMTAALAARGIPWLAIGGLPDASHGLGKEEAELLMQYYREGGEDNLRHFLRWLGRWQRGEATDDIPPPRLLPATGFYHPKATEPFATLETYLDWRKQQQLAEGSRIGIVISAQAIGNMQLRDIDAMIAALEARGLVPVTFWFEREAANGLQNAIAAARPAALLNMTHLGNGRARAADIAALGVPVTIAMTARGHTLAQWRQAASGVPASTVATLMATPESWGMSDPMVLAAVENGEPVPIPEQIEAVAERLAAQARLRDTDSADKRIGLMFWNSPDGEKNLGASQLNLPRSLAGLTRTLATHGYQVPVHDAERITADAQAMLSGWYRPQTLRTLLQNDLAAAFPVREYRRVLESWPKAQQQALQQRWGAPEQAANVLDINGEPHFIIPRQQLGHLVLMPQPPRAQAFGIATHDSAVPPTHAYLASYLWLRQHFVPHALLHFGTHGTQEWLPGKDRGLSAHDWPNLAIGALPVFYPYIQDNIGEGTQVKRRGRAVIISHQTPPFAPSGLYDQLRQLHDVLHEYQQAEEGPVRNTARQRLLLAARQAHLDRDMGWDAAAIAADREGFILALHDHLHALANRALPLGLHVFGQSAAEDHRLLTVMQQLGADFIRATGNDPDEVFAGDFSLIKHSAPYQLLHAHLREGRDIQDVQDPQLRQMLETARQRDAALAQPEENEMLLQALAGGWVPPGEAGDPIRNPAARGGRNLYAFDAAKIPTRAAYQTGGEAFSQLLAQHQASHGSPPRKLAFVMWSVETVRHLGIQEAQILHAAGLRPVWDSAGRLQKLEIIPRAQLGRPRIDVLVQVAGSYRDQFDGFMQKLDDALQKIAALDEPDNHIAAHSRALQAKLQQNGLDKQAAEAASRLRLFGNAPGDYGTGFTDRVLDSSQWQDEAPLAEQFISRMQHAYGGREWGTAQQAVYNEQLRASEGVVLPRSSNVYGALNTDHVFEYMGGLSTAIRSAGGQAPALYLNDLTASTPRTVTAARYIASELRSRYLNPQWIGAMQAEGYAGTLEVLEVTQNLFGWQASAPGTVRDDQWQALHETYITDRRGLGTGEWFNASNPDAKAQIIARMAEAIRKGMWQADSAIRQELAEHWRELKSQGVSAGDAITRAFLDAGLASQGNAPAAVAAPGFGLGKPRPDAAAPAPTAAAATPASPEPPAKANAPERFQGQVLRQVPPPTALAVPAFSRFAIWLLAALLFAGALWQWRSPHFSQSGVNR